MSVLFTTISPNNPVTPQDVDDAISPLGLVVKPDHKADFAKLLASVHDIAEHIMALEDYQPKPNLQQFPRRDITRPTPEENVLGAAWSHQFFIEGSATGPLEHMKVCLKDNIAVAGIPLVFGTDAIAPRVPDTDATVVVRLLEAGADIVGTTVCENFCNSTSSFTSAQGTVQNPHAWGHSAGGSTSGAAALVAGGHVDAAIGADQGGSIRIPSALSGCVGFKPTHGLVPFTGLVSGDAVIDHAGPLAKDTRTAARIMDAIAGNDGIDDRSRGASEPGTFSFESALLRPVLSQPRPLENFRVAILKEAVGHPAIEHCVALATRAAAEHFAHLGAAVTEISIEDHLEGPALWSIQQRIAGSQNLLGRQNGRHGLYLTDFEARRVPWTPSSFDKLFASTQNIIINGEYLLARFPGLYGKTMNLIRKLSDQYEQALTSCDVLLMPTSPRLAPKHGKRAGPIESLAPSMGLTINTCGFNVTGHPAISVPAGFGVTVDEESGNPVKRPAAIQLVGALGQDEKVLQIAHAWETSWDWRTRTFRS